MTTLEAYRAFDGVPAERRPQGLPLLPGVEDDLLWPLYMTAACRLAGQLEGCRRNGDLEGAACLFADMLRNGELTLKDWTDEALAVLAEYMAACEQQLEATRAVAELN